jgi:F420-non-reducing hydrogenase iron-sulfur subunit
MGPTSGRRWTLPSKPTGAKTKAPGAVSKRTSGAARKKASGATGPKASGAAGVKAAGATKTRASAAGREGTAGFEPRVVAFACNWCSYPAADAAGINKMQYPPNARIIRVMCAGRIHPAFVLRALELGADGVLVSGCHFADCHYLFGAKRAAEQFEKTAALVRLLGIEKERVRFEQISAAEAPKFVKVMNDFVADLRRLGRSPLAGMRSGELAIPDAIGEERT